MTKFLRISIQTLNDLDNHIIQHRKMMICLIYYKYMRDTDVNLCELLEKYCSIKNIFN